MERSVSFQNEGEGEETNKRSNNNNDDEACCLDSSQQSATTFWAKVYGPLTETNPNKYKGKDSNRKRPERNQRDLFFLCLNYATKPNASIVCVNEMMSI